MKKKLIQILMLLVVAVSVGSFVSCKDTNEDLYNELRTQYIKDNASLKDAFDAQIAELERQLGQYKTALDAINSCECDEDALNGLINGLTEQINGINGQIATLTAGLNNAATKDEVNAINTTIARMQQQVDDLDRALQALLAQFNPLATEFASYKTAQDILKQTVDDLTAELNQVKSDLAGVNQCQCDYNYVTNKLVELETKMSAAEAQAKQAYDLATSAVTKADEAKDIANGASSTANEAKLTAQQAKDAADAATTAATNATNAAQQAVTTAALAQQAAEAAGLTANEAKQFAQQAQENANTALQTANAANALATSANTLAQTALDKANENAANIATLQENARIVENLVNKNTQDIAQNAQDITSLQEKVQKNIEDIAKNAADIATNAQNIQTNAQNIQNNAQEISNIKTQLTSMSEATQRALDRANEAYAKAEANYNLINGINETIAGMKGTYDEKFRNLENTTNTLTENLQRLTEVVGGNTAKIEGLQTSVNNVTSTVDRLSTKLDSLGTVVSDLKTELAEVKATCEGLLDKARLIAKEEVAAAKAEILAEVATRLEDYVKKADLPDFSQFATQEQLKDSMRSIVQKVLTEVGKDRERISANETAIWYINEALKYLSEKFENYYTSTEVDALLGQAKSDITLELTNTLNEKISDLKEEINNELDDKINQILEDGNYITEDDVEPIVDQIIAGASSDDIQSLVELVTRVMTLENTTVKVDDYELDKQAIWDQVNTNTTDISDIKSQLETINNTIETIQNDITDLKDRMDAVEDRLDDVEEAIEELNEDVAAIQDALSKQVTGIIVQGTYNPMFGTLNIPVGIQSNVLVAYYGVPFKDVEFPTDDDQNYVRKSEVLTAQDMAMINGVEIFEAPANLPLLNENGSAGKIYMTINPNTVDFTRLQPTIVNTLDEESFIKLSPIRKCNEKLQFGYTRADNGFYVADATVTPRTVMEEDNGLALTREDITALYHDVQEQIMGLANNFNTPGKQTDLGKLATDIYQVIRNMKVDRNGLKVTYTTQEKNPDGSYSDKEHSVYSEYNLAATFFKPLNLAWGKDFNYSTMPGYEFFDDYLNRFASTLKNHVDVIYNDAINIGAIQNLIGNLQIDEIAYVGEANALISNFEARVSHIVLNGVDYRIMVPAAGGFDVKFNKNLKANGAAMSIPAAIAYDEEHVTLERAAIVIGGDIVTGMNATLVVPAKGVEDGVVAAYATLKLDNMSATVTSTPDVINITTADGTYTIANLAGTSINTTGCTPRLILSNVVGTGGTLSLPVALEISSNIRSLLERQGITLNNVVAELNAMLNNINSYHGAINGWIDQGFDEFLRKYLDQLNEDVVYFFNSINRRFGPFMVASNEGKGFKRLSASKEYPTILKTNGLKFYPTSKSLELIVPLARKHVAVTNVFKGTASAQGGNSECKSALNAANTGKLNTVIDGTLRCLEVTGLKKGFVYEVAYSILDFDGNISTQKYYVTVE